MICISMSLLAYSPHEPSSTLPCLVRLRQPHCSKSPIAGLDIFGALPEPPRLRNSYVLNRSLLQFNKQPNCLILGQIDLGRIDVPTEVLTGCDCGSVYPALRCIVYRHEYYTNDVFRRRFRYLVHGRGFVSLDQELRVGNCSLH